MPWAVHLNNTLMLIAVFLLALGHSKSRLNRFRHPMLTAVMIWAVAHLLVNGNVPALVLFGTLGLWAIAEMIVISRSDPDWTPPPREKQSLAGDIRWVVISVVVFVVIVLIHGWIGPSPFGAM